MRTFTQKVLFLGLLFIWIFSISSNAQVLINEICPSNVSLVQNSNGKYDDWIELYNAGGSSVNLSGYGLTDDNSKPYQFTFPSYTLGSGQRMLIFASDSNNTVLINHWEMAVNALSSWKYAIGSASIDTNWRNNSFSDGSWSSGNGGIGFGDGDDGTTISVTTSVFMRKSFTIPDTSQILKGIFFMDYDDGFVAYLNGVEIARANLGIAGTRPKWNDFAPGSHEAMMYQGGQADSFYVDPVFLKSILRQGTNVLSVETHNNTASSSDMSSIPYLFFGMRSSGLTFSNPPSWFRAPAVDYYNAKFKLSRSGETVYLRNSGGTIIDQKTYTSMDADHSFGRKPDGNSSWCYFSTPTPASSNNSSTCYTGYASAPVFSISGGYYSSPRTITLSSSTPGGVIRYSTNGNEPTSGSTLYSGAITVSSTKNLRARVFASGYLPSATVTNTYFIDEDVDLPIFSISTDSLNLWDYNTGIYVLGPNAEAASPYFGANFWQPWSKPATVEFFDKSKNRVLRFDSEIEIFGNYSRAKPQKSFEIKLSDRYGTSEINYPLISDKPFISKYDNIILRNSGTDWNVTHFRDALMERIMKNTYCGYLAAEPAVMFLNGEFWGVYTIHEKHDENWIQLNYGLSKSQFDYLRESGSSVRVENGSDGTFWSMYNYATTQNASTQQYYDYMNSVLDIKNYADYFIAETYYNNGDWIGEWTNNIKMWRPNAPGSKWRYLLYDTDYGFGLKGSVNDNRLELARNPIEFSHSSEMFDAILGNPTFKRYFINRYADLINTIYLPSNVDNVVHQFQDSMASDMVGHFAKWGSNTSTWQSNINSLMTFVNARPTIMRDYIRSGFGLTSKVTLTLQTSPAGSGRIEISTITPTSYPWSGVYYNGNPVTITAIPNPGYTFDRWRSNVVISSNNYNQSVTYNFTANDVITCYFTGSPATAKLTVSEINYNSDSATNAHDWIELYNYGTQTLDISGWKFKDEEDNHIFQFPTGTTLASGAYLVLVEDTAKFRAQFPNVNNRMGPLGFNLSNGGEQVRIYDYQDNLYLSFTYQDQAPWPTSPDGGGYTLELLSPTGNLNSGSNWFAGCIGGSPGRAYSPLLATPVSVTGNTTFCTGGSVLLSATNNPGYSYQWKRNGSNVSGGSTSSYTADLGGSYTVAVTYQGCSVISDPVTVTVVTQGPDPVTTSASRCGDGVVTLTATSTDSIFWYDAPAGNLLGNGTSFTTPALNTTTTFYSRSSTICPSNPVPATATILTPTSAPVTSDVTRCGPGTVTLTATDTATVYWYNSPVNGALLNTGSTFVTNVIYNDSVFYVEAGSVCPSPRVEVHVTINTTPSPVAQDNFRCGTGVVVLSATAANPMFWYNSYVGGSSIGSGPSFTTPSISQSDTFYVEANSGCASVRTRVIALVEPILAAPTASGANDCVARSFTLQATSTGQVYWYDAASGGNLLYTGTVFTTPVIASSTSYYIEAGDQCRSSRTQVNVVIDPAPAAPSTSDNSRCGPGSVNLTANSSEQVYWYSAASGGTLLFTGSTYTTPSISSTTTYYVEAGNANCRSSRIAVQAIINSVPAAPVIQDGSRCGTGTVTLNATSSETIFWYSASSGGTLLSTGSSYTTPSISSTTTYYVETGNTCLSSRVAVQAIISANSPVPTGSDVSRCGTGTVTLTASGAGTLSWFADATGGSSLGTGTVYTTPSISISTTYYVEANNGCVSASRKAIQAIIDPVPAVPSSSNASRCGSGTVSLSATGSGNIYWYSAASGGTLLFTGNPFTTPSISNTTTYYVETGNVCRSNRISVQAIINPIPAPPSTIDVTRCGSGSVTLTASAPTPISWFSQSSGGIAFTTGTSYTTPVLTSTTTYYIETGTSCISNRIPVRAIIGVEPAAPSASNSSRCGTGTLVLTASSPEQIYWFANASGGTALSTGSSFTTPIISNTTTYYAEAGNNCRSLTRTAVQAIILSGPAAPTASNVSRCGQGSVTLNASSTEQVYWYDSASGANLLFTGPSFTTPSITSTTTYYVEAGNTCRSNRISVQAIINSIPAAPSASNVSRCGPGVVTLTATAGSSIAWYSVASGGTAIGTGTSYTTPSLASTTTYYVETGTTCISPRVPVQAIISSLPATPVLSGGSRCGSGSVVLTGSSSTRINWYSVASGGTLLDTGATFNTPSISSTTTFYADAGQGCNSARVPVTATITSLPAVPVTADSSRCGAGTVTLAASSPEQIYWYTVSSGGSSVATGTTYTTPSISVNTTYYVETGNDCRSLRVAVNALITPPTASPVASDVSRCGSGVVTLTAISSQTIRWYEHSTGGPVLFVGASFTTPSLSSDENYYAEAGDICPSIRTRVKAIITSQPAAPTLTDGERCGPGSVTLTGVSSNQINWYDQPSGGTLLGTGPTFNTPVISSNTVFYADAGLGCNSNRVPVSAEILAMPSAPSVTPDSVCGSGQLTLNAVSSDSIYWFDAAIGGSQVGTGATFTTPNISTSTTYFVEVGDICRSIRRAVTAVVIPTSQFLVIENGFACGTGSVSLTATSNDIVRWYDAAGAGVLLDSGNIFVTPVIDTITTYYAIAGDRCPSPAVPVTATIHPELFVNIGPDTVIIQSGQSVMLDPGAGFYTYLWSNSDTTRTLLVNTSGSYSVIVSDSNGCTGSDIVVVMVSVAIDESIKLTSFKIYPNPTHEKLNLEWSAATSSKATIQVFTSDGRQIIFRDLRAVSGAYTDFIDVRNFAAGVYLLHVRDEKSSWTSRFVVE